MNEFSLYSTEDGFSIFTVSVKQKKNDVMMSAGPHTIAIEENYAAEWFFNAEGNDMFITFLMIFLF